MALLLLGRPQLLPDLRPRGGTNFLGRRFRSIRKMRTPSKERCFTTFRQRIPSRKHSDHMQISPDHGRVQTCLWAQALFS